MDCHAFEFMQRALQDLKKTAFNLDARVGEVLLNHHFPVLFPFLGVLFEKRFVFHAVEVLNAHDSPADESFI